VQSCAHSNSNGLARRPRYPFLLMLETKPSSTSFASLVYRINSVVKSCPIASARPKRRCNPNRERRSRAVALGSSLHRCLLDAPHFTTSTITTSTNMHGREGSSGAYQSLATVPTSLEEAIPPAAIQDSPIEEYEDGVLVVPPPVSPRIRWIHFVLGCAVLLPWNGACQARRHLVSS